MGWIVTPKILGVRVYRELVRSPLRSISKPKGVGRVAFTKAGFLRISQRTPKGGGGKQPGGGGKTSRGEHPRKTVSDPPPPHLGTCPPPPNPISLIKSLTNSQDFPQVTPSKTVLGGLQEWFPTGHPCEVLPPPPPAVLPPPLWLDPDLKSIFSVECAHWKTSVLQNKQACRYLENWPFKRPKLSAPHRCVCICDGHLAMLGTTSLRCDSGGGGWARPPPRGPPRLTGPETIWRSCKVSFFRLRCVFGCFCSCLFALSLSCISV